RSAGMGDVNSVLSSQCLYNNPSVLPWIENMELSVQHMSYLVNTSYNIVTFVKPLENEYCLGSSIGYFGVSDLAKTEYDAGSIDGYKESGSFGFSDMFVNLGFGKKVSTDFSYGMALKVVRESIDNNTSSSVMASLSGYYSPIKENWHISFGLFNFGTNVKDYSLPSGGFLSIGNQMQKELLWIGEIVAYSDTLAVFATGIEYSFVDVLILRLGYKYSMEDMELGEFPNVNITGGIGLNINKISLDYAWMPYGDIGTAHRISFTLKFGGYDFLKETIRTRYEDFDTLY
ncbi:MAG: hypothetical protein JW871_08905, partial [Endomicrobiales bacterium]|nr:hypothetical protein [Endomicrobiales bacterium]